MLRPLLQQAWLKIHLIFLAIRTLADGGQLEIALAKCDRYLQDSPTSAAAYLLLGEIYRARDDISQAESAFQKALYLNPDCVESLNHLVLLCKQKGNDAAAERLQQRLTSLTARLTS